MTTEPTDAELQQLWQNSNPTNFEAISFARAVLAKWGQPSGAGEAVYQFRRAHCSDWYDGHADHGDGGGPYEERTLYTTPQPTQTVPPAGREPLTAAQVSDLLESAGYWSRDPDFINGIRYAEAAHGIGIKGSQHER